MPHCSITVKPFRVHAALLYVQKTFFRITLSPDQINRDKFLRDKPRPGIPREVRSLIATQYVPPTYTIIIRYSEIMFLAMSIFARLGRHCRPCSSSLHEPPRENSTFVDARFLTTRTTYSATLYLHRSHADYASYIAHRSRNNAST